MTRGITVPGHGEISARPTLARFSLTVEATRPTVGQAREQVARTATALLAALRAAGIAPADLQTGAIAIHPIYTYPADGGQVLEGHRASYGLRVTARNLSALASVLDSAVAVGGDATRLDGLTFGVADEEAMRIRARAAAMKDARRRARQLARLAKVRTGKAASINENPAVGWQPYYESRAMQADAAGTPIEGGQVLVAVDLVVRYRIR